MRHGVQHWNCEFCKRYNDVLNTFCVFCKVLKPSWIPTQYQMLVEIERGIYDCRGVLAIPARYDDWEGRVNQKLMTTPNEELHAKFFNEEAVIVATMNDADLDEHIHELETIAREAKARILAGTQEKRNRAAKSGNKSWRVEPLGPDPTVSDSLNQVKQRSARMGKLDSMRAKMAALGIPDAELDQMMAKMVAAARKDPKALKEENKLKNNLNTPQPPTVITEEELAARAARRKALEAEDKAIEKAEKEALVANKKDETLIALEEKPAVVPAPNPFEPNNSKQDEKKALYDLFANPKKAS